MTASYQSTVSRVFDFQRTGLRTSSSSLSSFAVNELLATDFTLIESRISFRTLLFPARRAIIFAIFPQKKKMERSVGIGFIFQCWNLEDFESITARERLTRLAARSVSISSAIRRIRTQSHLYSQADIVSKRWQLHAVFTRYNNFSGDRIRVHASIQRAQATKSAPLIDSRLARDRSDRVLIFQIHISLPRGNYPATAGRSSSFENSNFQSFISFSRSSIFSRKIVEHVERGIIEIGIWISQLFP